MSIILEREILEALKDISSKLDAIITKLDALEERVIGIEEPEPEDVEAYHEAERELREGRLVSFEKG